MKGFILIYIITVLGSAAALRWPLIGLYVYVGFAVLRPQGIWGWAGDLSGISLIVGIATLIGWAARGFGSWRPGRGRSIVIALLAFAAWSGISATQALNTEVAYDALISMAKFLMPVLIGVSLLDSEERSRRMLWIIVLAQGYVAFELNYDYVNGYNLAAEGFAGMDNNCLGLSLVCTIGPAMALGIGAAKWTHRAVAAAAGALILHATLLTFSRGAMVGLLTVGAAAFVIMPKRPKYLAVLALSVALAIRLVGPQLAERYMSAFADERDQSAESRIDLWRDSLEVAVEHPLFGIGPANFPLIASSLGWTEGKQAHSVWMQTAAENGFPGVIALFMFFALCALKLWPIARARQNIENRFSVAVASGVMMSIAGFVVGGQFVSLAGLEVPYYVTMVGIVLLKSLPHPVRASAPQVFDSWHEGRIRTNEPHYPRVVGPRPVSLPRT